MTILERDLEFYAGIAEQARANRRRCTPSMEAAYLAEAETAEAIVAALQAHGMATQWRAHVPQHGDHAVGC